MHERTDMGQSSGGYSPAAANIAGDTQGSRYGMWLFLYSEIMLFGGLFVLYAAYFHRYMNDFIAAGGGLLTAIGAVNTVILLLSSFLVAASITAIRRDSKKSAMLFLAAAVGLALLFLGNKYVEWSHEIARGIYPGSAVLLEKPSGEIIFFGLYFTITGLHAIHVLVGMTILAICIVLIRKGRISAARYIVLENSGLYWHLVDIIWIFIFPLFYLLL